MAELTAPGANRRWLTALKVGVSGGLLFYLLRYQVDLAQLWATLRGARWEYLLIAGLLIVLGTALRAVRWQALLQALEMEVLLRRLIYLYFVGAFFNIFLPSGLGGDAVRMAELTQSTQRGPEAVGTTLVDRAMGLWVLFALALVALPFSGGLLPPGWTPVIGAIAAVGVVGGWVVVTSPLLPWLGRRVKWPGREKVERFAHAVAELGYPALARASLVSLVFDLLLIAFNVLVAAALGVRQPLGVFLLFTPLISFSLALPISVGGLGVREQTYVLLFGAVGVPETTAVAMSLLNYTLSHVIVGLLGGLLYAVSNAKELAVHV
ncbi:MAG: lysylphosphatidylglycerol synthase transmembrane domain-containing protein [Anaerolineae bacterium]